MVKRRFVSVTYYFHLGSKLLEASRSGAGATHFVAFKEGALKAPFLSITILGTGT